MPLDGMPGEFTLEATLTGRGEALAGASERIWALPAMRQDEWPGGARMEAGHVWSAAPCAGGMIARARPCCWPCRPAR